MFNVNCLIINEIDFSAFEEAFKLNPAPLNKRGKDESDQANKTPTIKAPQLKSLMEHTRYLKFKVLSAIFLV